MVGFAAILNIFGLSSDLIFMVLFCKIDIDDGGGVDWGRQVASLLIQTSDLISLTLLPI